MIEVKRLREIDRDIQLHKERERERERDILDILEITRLVKSLNPNLLKGGTQYPPHTALGKMYLYIPMYIVQICYI